MFRSPGNQVALKLRFMRLHEGGSKKRSQAGVLAFPEVLFINLS